MKIAILNECFFTDTHLARLRELGEVVIYDVTDTEEQTIERLRDVNIALTDCYVSPLTKRVLKSTTCLKFISINSTGYDLVDLSACSEKKVSLANIPGFSTAAVAEHTFGLILALAKKIPLADKEVRIDPFQIDPGNSDHRKQYLGTNLRGKTLGIIGLGAIGCHVAEIAHGFGMNIVAYNRSPKELNLMGGSAMYHSKIFSRRVMSYPYTSPSPLKQKTSFHARSSA